VVSSSDVRVGTDWFAQRAAMQWPVAGLHGALYGQTLTLRSDVLRLSINTVCYHPPTTASSLEDGSRSNIQRVCHTSVRDVHGRHMSGVMRWWLWGCGQTVRQWASTLGSDLYIRPPSAPVTGELFSAPFRSLQHYRRLAVLYGVSSAHVFSSASSLGLFSETWKGRRERERESESVLEGQ